MNKNQLILLYIISMAAVVICFFVEPIRQDNAYHLFADDRALWSVPNFWNVVSNLPFVLVGIVGLIKMQSVESRLKSNYIWFFVGIFLTGFGSGYYHWQPNSVTLVWDRLPMTISFMSFLSVIIGEFIDGNSGKKFLYPLICVGVLSVVNWVVTGDLRMYALVQFLPIALILIILFLSKKERKHKKYFWLMVVAYVIAKFFESYDGLIFKVTLSTASGHVLKHIAAAMAPYLLYRFLNAKFIPRTDAAPIHSR